MTVQTQIAPEASFVEANGTTLYAERRGSGPSVLFIGGATGDAGHFSHVAEVLADEFAVVTYDRRGNSRSPVPPGWTKTSIAEQADDAAALIEALGLAPAAVFGTSGGAEILLELLVRRPDVLRGAIVHEPPIIGVLENAGEIMAELQAMAEQGLATGGPRAAMELFIRANAGDRAFEELEPALQERMLGNADLFFGVELEPMAGYLPDPAALAEVRVPIRVAAGAENAGLYYYATAEWVARSLGTTVHVLPGAHAPYFDRPAETAEALRPLLRGLS